MPISSSLPPPMQLRRHLVDMLRLMQAQVTPSRTEREKVGQFLLGLAPSEAWYPFLLKELEACENNQHKRLEAVSDLLMEMGELNALQKPLYALVANPKVADDVKDMIHIMLRSLGDHVDPEFFFENMKDPESLLEREAQRIFETAEENPDAMTEFIEAFLDLPSEELFEILQGVQNSIPARSLSRFALPLLLNGSPLLNLRIWLLKSLGNSVDALAVWGIYNRYFRYEPVHTIPLAERKEADLALKKLQLSGVYHTNDTERIDLLSHITPSWALTIEKQDAYATYISGDGDQALLLVTQWKNGDFSLMLILTNDTKGIDEAVVHNYLTQAEMKRWLIRFDDGEERFNIPLSFFRETLLAREALNFKKGRSLPYRYTCWRSLLFTFEAEEGLPPLERCVAWQKESYKALTYTLVREDAFEDWYLEAEDATGLPILFDALIKEWKNRCDLLLKEQVKSKEINTETFFSSTPLDFSEYIDTWCKHVKQVLEENGHAHVLKERMASFACLYAWQGKRKLPALMATEIEQFEEALHGKRFLMQYLRRSAIFQLQRWCDENPDYLQFLLISFVLLEKEWGYMPIQLRKVRL